MIETTCGFCSCTFNVQPYRLKKGTPIYCSCSCSKRGLYARGYKPHNKQSEETVNKARRLFTKTTKRDSTIAAELGVDRVTIYKWAKAGGWKRFERTHAPRTTYRKAAISKIGRRLMPYEQVHHKDGDIHNNVHENLHVFPDAQSHTISHRSLEKCAFELFRRGVIKFDDESGLYVLA